MPHTLPKLPYPYDALEPHLDARTMEIHHAKHHQAYVDNLNKALATHPSLADWTIEDVIRRLAEVPEDIRTAVRNHGGGHLNHTWFWQWMMPRGGGQPSGQLVQALTQTFGGFEAFKEKFTQSAVGRFGSGWAWLVVKGGKLEITSTPNQDNPLTDGATPILGCDVWEHAYYLTYQNRRAEYLAAWWNVVNWAKVGEMFAATL